MTFLILTIAKKNELYDIPNERSSHEVPTPRGGGLAIVLVFVVLVILYSLINFTNTHINIIIGFLLVGIFGLLDDRFNLSPRVRFIIQLVSIIIVIYSIGIPSKINLFGLEESNKYFVMIISVFSVLWMTNLFNFMDGIDGLASIEAISILSGIFLLNYFYYSKIILIPIFLLAAILGFLIWNWHPAKIFMGDVGSSSLGFLFGIWALYSESLFNMDFTSFHLLIIVFTLDATVTLFRRLFSGQKIIQAHKLHFYQRAVQSGWKHSKVSIITGILNIFAVTGVFVYIKGEILFGSIIAIVPIIIFFFVVEKRRSFSIALREHSSAD